MELDLSTLTTEQVNHSTKHIDQLSTMEILSLMNQEDHTVPRAVEQVLPQVKEVIEKTYTSLKAGGRLFYIGAGTSGRLGVIDASECPPTFRTAPELVQAIMAGGNGAMFRAVEGAEDDEQQGATDLLNHQLSSKDVVVGIAASGRTPYVLGALKFAREKGATTVALSCNRHAAISCFADYPIEVIVGPEVLTGSTRLKAATAHKLILNMISTVSMIKLGKVYQNLMVDVQPTNQKLVERAKRIIMEATDSTYETAADYYQKANGHVKAAIVMILLDCSYDEALTKLQNAKGFIRKTVEK